jgi:hypothetical protein
LCGTFIIVIVMGGLFEGGKLTSSARYFIATRMPTALKIAL